MSLLKLTLLILHFLSSLFLIFGDEVAPAVGTVYVKFDSYRQQDPNSCDASWFLKDECDPYFIIAVSTPSRVLATFYSTEINNAPIVSHFSNRIGQLTNPMEFHFTSSDLKATDSLQLSVIVKDKNSGADTFMCDFSQVLNASSVALFANNTVNSSWSGQLTELHGSRPGHRLKLAVWIKCRPNFYQAGCSVHCDPSRFRCGPDGSRICPAGYAAVNGSCAPSDGCLRPGFCLNGGRCSAGLRGEPVCECAANFAGPRCQLETHPCLRNATWCSRGTCQTFSSNGTSACVCDKGFTGYHCDQDVDECRLVAGLCGSNGHCVNSVGSFRCVCADGYLGSVCQMKLPTPPVADATAIYEASPLTNAGIALPMLLLAVLLIFVVLLTAIIAGIMIYHRKHSSRVQLRIESSVAYQPNSSQAVTIMQANGEPVESTYYEEVEDESGAVPPGCSANKESASPTTGNFANSAYGRAPPEQVQLTLNSRRFSRKNSPAGSQEPPEPPPRSPSTTRVSEFGLGPYLTPNKLAHHASPQAGRFDGHQNV